MLRAPICTTSATSATGLDVARVHQLGDDRQAGALLGLGEQPQPLLPEALEGVGRRARLVGAAAEHRRAGRLDDVGGAAAPGRATRRCTARRSARSSRRRSGGRRSRAPTAAPWRSAWDASLYGLRIGTTLVDAGRARRARGGRRARGRRRRRSRSPPRRCEGCARAPTDSMRAMTAWISSGVAVGFMTIIIWGGLSAVTGPGREGTGPARALGEPPVKTAAGGLRPSA